MNAKLLTGWLQSPETLGREAGAQLDALTQAFPYFQTAQLLYIKTLHNENSFRYNNQLKTAAVYATNRRMLYELITRKPTAVAETAAQTHQAIEEPPAPFVATAPVVPEPEAPVVAEIPAVPSTPTPPEEPAVLLPEFPKKRFISNTDEWEAGMLRQLQLLHHWRNHPESTAPALQVTPQPEVESIPEPIAESAALEPMPLLETTADTEGPTAADEINTLLYVLAEPGDWDDVPNELVEQELPAEIQTHQEEPATWEVQPIEEASESAVATGLEVPEEIPALLTPEVAAQLPTTVPADAVDQLILAEAINASIAQEVNGRWPTPDELQPRKPATPVETSNPIAEPQPEPVAELPPAPKTIPPASELSFSNWLRGLDTTETPETVVNPTISLEIQEITTESIPETPVEPVEEPAPNQEEEQLPGPKQRIIDRFIREEPRIKPNKNKFYNPVNMARQSVQENDEFITETLARIYAKQGNIPKAVRAYQKLSLKFPEKSTYFAALIEELKRTPK